MLTAMLLRGNSDAIAAYHCRGENYYFKQATGVEREIFGLTGEFPQRDEALEYVRVHGSLAPGLGYKPGESITEAEFLLLMEGRTRSGDKATQKHKVRGIDLTFSAPKSVSITGLLLDRNPDIIKAHDEAVLEVMKEVEKHFAYARPNPEQQWSTGKMCYAAVRDGFSREHDPHLHTHVIVMNITEWQGRTMGLWTRKILQKDFNKAFGELYRCRLAARLAALGYSITYLKNGEWRLGKVSKELEEEFSRRRGQIAARRDAGDADMTAWRKTRIRKDHAVSKADILKDWLARLAKYTVNEADNIRQAVAERLAWSRKAEFSVEAAQEREGRRDPANEAAMWQHALRRATERSATASQQELVYEYLKETMRSGRWKDITYREALSRLQKQLSRGYVVPIRENNTERYTSLELLAAERGYIRYAGVDSAYDYSVDGREAARYIKDLNEFNRRGGRRLLSDIQGRAVCDILTSKNMISVVQGDAGAGKTTSLKAVAEYYRQQGFDVVGLAMQGVAAKKLAGEAGIGAMTLKSYLARKKSADRKVIIFDEASMLDSRSAERLFKSASENGDRIILVGDVNQLESINAGRVFERYVDYYSRMGGRTKAVKLVVMNENYRQRDPLLRRAVELARQGRMGESLGLLEKEKHVTEIPDAGARRAAIAGLYDKGTLIIVGTAAAREEVNERVRRALRAGGRLRGGREYTLAGTDAEGVGVSRILELAPGDVISFTRNEYRDYDVRNGDKAEVLDCGDGYLEVRMEDKRELRIDTARYGYIDYGYALTTYKSQGQTYDSVVVESDTAVPSLADMRNQYVNITRARDAIKIFTDDTDGLRELAGIKTHARDTLDAAVEPGEVERKMKILEREINAAPPERDDVRGGTAGWELEMEQ